MISDTILFFIIIVLLIYVFESRLIPQLLIMSIIIYRLYTIVIVVFNPVDVIITALPILYCLGHIINSADLEKKDD